MSSPLYHAQANLPIPEHKTQSRAPITASDAKKLRESETINEIKNRYNQNETLK